MSVVIIGLKGVGKTTVGWKLSKLLKYEFVDSDEEIERIYKASCREIWLTKGEKAFREIEENVILNLCPMKKSVIVLGGGAIESLAVRHHIRSLGVVISLYMNKGELQNRWEKDVPFYDRFEEIYQKRLRLMGSLPSVWVDGGSKNLVGILEGIICGK